MVSIVGFLKKNTNKKMTIKAWIYAALYRFQIRFRSRRRLEKNWGVIGEESEKTLKPWQYRYAYWVANTVSRVASHTPWESKCLVRALTARKLLKEKGISCTLYLGVGKDTNGDMVAHAWLRSGSVFISGGDGSDYAVVAKFRTGTIDSTDVGCQSELRKTYEE